MEQRKRLQSVSLDGLVVSNVVNPAHSSTSTEDLAQQAQLRRNMETISFEDLQHLDFEESNILKHLTRDLRGASRLPNINVPQKIITHPPSMAGGTTGNGLRGQPDLTRSLSPKRVISESNISFETLRDENLLLRQEVDALSKKASKIPKLESEMEKINQSYQLLLNSAEKRESLEQAMKMLLEREKQALRLENQQLRDQIDRHRRDIPALMEEQRSEAIRNYEKKIAKLMAKNKELTENQSRQEIELAAQKATLDEQRNHIKILDGALLSAQERVVKLEDELKKTQQVRSGHTVLFQPTVTGQRRQNSDESMCRPANWQAQKASSDSLNADSYHSSMEKIRSVEELSFAHTRPLDVPSQIKTTTVPRPDIAVSISKHLTPTGPTRAFGPSSNRLSFPNLTALPVGEHPRAEENRLEFLQPTNHQRPKSAASVIRETRTEQWQV